MSVENLLKKYTNNSFNYYYKNTKNYEKNIICKNEYNIVPKKGKYIIITFADKINNNKLGIERIKKMSILKEKLKDNSHIDEFIIYTLNDIDTRFKEKHFQLFNSCKFFAWISKIYLINKMFEKIDDDDIVLWIDSDVRDIQKEGTLNLFSLCENSENNLVGFHNNFWLEQYYCKRELLRYMNMENEIFTNTQQIYGGIVLFKKNQFILKIMKEWLDISIASNYIYFNDNIRLKQLDAFIGHRHCQSILSLLFKKYNVKTFPLPLKNMDKNDIIAVSAGYFNYSNFLPILWEPCWHDHTIEETYKNCVKKIKKNIDEKTLLISLKYLLLK